MNGDTLTLIVPTWGLLTSIAGFIGTAVVVIVGVLVSNRDLRVSIKALESETKRLGDGIDKLSETVSKIEGLDRMVGRETERGDAIHKAIFDRIDRLEKKVFDP